MKMLKAQLKQIRNLETRINPDHEWVLRNREQLMTQITHTSKQSVVEDISTSTVAQNFNVWAKIFVPRSLVRSLKPLASVTLALVLTTVGWIASAYAEPGDVLWNAKNAFNSVVENSRLVLASDEKQASLKLSYASKQAHVLKQVAETDRVNGEEKAKLVEKTVDSLQKKLDSAQESIKTLTPNEAANLVKEVSLSGQDISQTLQESKETLEKAGEQAMSEKIEKTVVETTKQSLEMVGDTMQKKTEANLEISSEEKEIVKDHIDQAVETIVADAMKAQNKLNTSSTTTPLLTSTTSSTVAITTSTPGISVTSSTVSSDLTRAFATVKTIDEQKKTVDSLKETNLLEAINTTKVLAEQVTQVTTVIENVSVQKTSLTVSTSSINLTPEKTTTSPTSSTR